MPDYAGDVAGLLQDIHGDNLRTERFLDWFKQSYDAFDDWRSLAIESYKFFAGRQWTEEDLAFLKANRRPALVINKVFSVINFVTGMQRQQRQEPKLLPRESEDVRTAQLMQALLKWVGDESIEAQVDSQVFFDKIVTGLGFWKICADYDEDPAGALRWERVNPLAVYPDPNFLDEGWKRAEYVIQARWFPLREAMDLWPEHADELKRQYGEWLGGESTYGTQSNLATGGEYAGDSLAQKRLFWDAETQRARVLEIWYVERKRVDVAIDQETGQVTTDDESVGYIKELMANEPMAAERVAITRQRVKRYRCAHVMNRILLDDEDSPYRAQGFPIYPAIGFYSWQMPFGLVEPMKDPQREKNRRRSTIVDMVSRMPMSGWLNKRTGGAKTEDIESIMRGNGAVLNYEDTPPIAMQSPELPQTLVWLDKTSDEEVRDVVNVNREMLGQGTQRTVSGRAIESRQRSGMVVQEPMFDSFEIEKNSAVKYMIQMVQQYVTPEQARRILGSLLARNPDMPAAQVMNQAPEDELTQLLGDAMMVEYDVVVSQRSFSPTEKSERWKTILELVQSFGDAVPPAVVIDAAKDAGIISEDDAAKIRMHVEQQQQMQQATVASTMQSGSPPPAEALQ